MGTIPRIATVGAVVDAPPTAVWEVVGDPVAPGVDSRMPRGARSSTGPRAGRRRALLPGRNQVGKNGWSRTCGSSSSNPGRSASAPSSAALQRQHDLDDHRGARGDGTRITQRYEVVKLGPVMDRFIYQFVKVHRDRGRRDRRPRRIGDVSGQRRARRSQREHAARPGSLHRQRSNSPAGRTRPSARASTCWMPCARTPSYSRRIDGRAAARSPCTSPCATRWYERPVFGGAGRARRRRAALSRSARPTWWRGDHHRRRRRPARHPARCVTHPRDRDACSRQTRLRRPSPTVECEPPASSTGSGPHEAARSTSAIVVHQRRPQVRAKPATDASARGTRRSNRRLRRRWCRGSRPPETCVRAHWPASSPASGRALGRRARWCRARSRSVARARPPALEQGLVQVGRRIVLRQAQTWRSVTRRPRVGRIPSDSRPRPPRRHRTRSPPSCAAARLRRNSAAGRTLTEAYQESAPAGRSTWRAGCGAQPRMWSTPGERNQAQSIRDGTRAW